MSLKGALIFTTLLCVIGGVLVCSLEITLMERARIDLYNTYIEPYKPPGYAQRIVLHSPEEEARYEEKAEFSGTFEYSSGGKYAYIEVDMPQFYRNPETGEIYPMADTNPSQFIPNELFRFYYANSGILILTVCFFTAAAFFFLNAVWFYRWKLKKPLNALREASEKIAGNDLDFTVSPLGGDEMGKLCASFEKMRGSLEENNKAMWKAMEERRRLNAAFAHDLRTPLTVLRGYSDYLLEGLPAGEISAEKAEETAATMQRSLIRLQRYVESMNSVQKLEDLTPKKTEVAFSQLSAQLRDTAEIMRGREGFSFSSSGEGELFLDQELVFQVFENLMSNAGRYARDSVEVSVRAEDRVLTLAVADDGPGFSPEALKKAAEPYYRGERGGSMDPPGAETDADRLHFGLGLTICRVLCEKHGGNLTLQNRPQGGALVRAKFGS